MLSERRPPGAVNPDKKNREGTGVGGDRVFREEEERRAICLWKEPTERSRAAGRRIIETIGDNGGGVGILG